MPRKLDQEHTQIAKWFFILASGAVLFLFWKILEPYAITIITAGVVAIVLSPIDKQFAKVFKYDRARALVLTSAILVLLVLPLFLLGLVMFDQAREVLELSVGDSGLLKNFDIEENPWFAYVPEFVRHDLASINFDGATLAIASWTRENIGNIFSKTAKLFINTLLFFISVYYILLDREKIKKEIIALSPFRDKLDAKILTRIISTVRGIVFGALLLAIIQGIFAAIGMAIFGVPGALIWGALVIIAAQVPLVGVGLILIPAIAYLFIIGDNMAGLGLLIWSGTIVGLSDNLLAPILMKGKTHMHGLLILISILGGLELFGSIGLIIGPTILAAVMVVLELYKSGVLEKKPAQLS